MIDTFLEWFGMPFVIFDLWVVENRGQASSFIKQCEMDIYTCCLYHIGCSFFWVVFLSPDFFCFSVWGTFPCYLLHFGAKTYTLLNFGARICHLHCSSIFPWCSLIYPKFSLIFRQCSLSLPWVQLIFPWFQSDFHAYHAPGEHVEYRLKHNPVGSKQWHRMLS